MFDVLMLDPRAWWWPIWEFLAVYLSIVVFGAIVMFVFLGLPAVVIGGLVWRRRFWVEAKKHLREWWEGDPRYGGQSHSER